MWLPKRSLIALSIIWNLNYIFVATDDVLVQTKVGSIRGLPATDGNYNMFMGIPYAKIDEKQPFGYSTPYQKFDDIYFANNDSAKCPQVEYFRNTIVGSLDCLYLNIYVPKKANLTNPLPVMVYIHGGSFESGFSGRYQFGPKYLVRHDVILVTFNYRLGPYGFMCVDIPEVRGNQGLKDQVIALNWVKDNIEAFGGDVNNTTVFGVSAGGHSIDFHLIYGDENLFNNAILQSGSSLAASVIVEPDKQAPLKLAKYFGQKTDSIKEALDYLADVNPQSIIKAVAKLGIEFKPCIEKNFNDSKSFVTKSWINVEMPNVKGKRIMTGYNELEMVADKTISDDLIFESLNRTFDFNSDELYDMQELVQHFYCGDKDANENKSRNLTLFDSDYTYAYPVYRNLRRFLAQKPEKLYYYMFAYVGERNNGLIIANVSVAKSAHSDEIGYLFDPEFLDKHPNAADQTMIDRMTSMWTNFAKYGEPTPETSELLPVKWDPISKDKYYCLIIHYDPKIVRRPGHRRMAFWDAFYRLNKKSQKFYNIIN